MSGEGVTHVAGLRVTFTDCTTSHVPRLRQRCAWCGALLVDFTPTAYTAGDPPPAVVAWAPGTLVRITDAGLVAIPDPTVLQDAGTTVAHTDPVPGDSCMRIDPEVTA